jgi:hypothetical protein
MPTVLHILTQSQDALPQSFLAAQQASDLVRVEVVDLTQPDPDYDNLLERIFAADSVAVW